MILKKYQANTETEAIMLAKEELGKDAIVMNIKTISPKGIYKFFRKSVVEVTAAIDDNKTYHKEKYTVKQELKNSAQFDVINEEKTSKESKEEPTSAIEQRLNSLQSLLEKQMSEKSKQEQEWEQGEEQPQLNQTMACIQLIYKQLLYNEVDEKYANQILTEIENSMKKESSMDKILSSVYQKIVLKLGQPETIPMSDQKPKFIFFIGPTGVGKTTTIAKIASKLKLNDKAKIAFLAADTYRIAAVDQLRTYANILEIPLDVVYSKEEVANAKENFSDFDYIFIDTAGRSHKNKEQRDDLEALIQTIPEEERLIYLVLSATTKYRDLIRITESYSEIINYKLIFTKLDETSFLGNVFNVRMLTGAPLSYVTFGQNVPDDLDKIDAQSIAKQLLRGQ